MDSKTNRRLKTMRQAMRSFHRTEGSAIRDVADPGSTLIVALSEDRVGDVLDRVQLARQKATHDKRIHVVMSKGPRVLAAMSFAGRGSGDLGVNLEPSPVSVDSEFGMLVDLVMMTGGALNLKAIAPGYDLEMVGALSNA